MPPNGVIFSDFMLTFAMSLKILLVLKCSTKISEKLTWHNPGQFFVAQGVIKLIQKSAAELRKYET